MYNMYEEIVKNLFDKMTLLFSEAPGFLLKTIFVIVLIYVWPKIIKKLLNIYNIAMRKTSVDHLIKSFTESILKVLMYVALILLVVGFYGVEATSLFAVLGTAGLAVGLALQGSLSNLAGGVLILIFKPFVRDDYVVVAGVEGIVKEIQMLYTVITTPDNKEIIIPNSQIANGTITNVTKNPVRRLDMMFSVGYDSSIDKVKELLTKIANEQPTVLKDREFTIRLFIHSASSLDFVCRVWVKKEDYWSTKFDFMEKVKEIFDENGIEIPYQKIDIYNK